MTRKEILSLEMNTNLMIHDAFSALVTPVRFVGKDAHHSELLTFTSGDRQSDPNFSLKSDRITEAFAACVETKSDYDARQNLPAEERETSEEAIEDAKSAYVKSLLKDRDQEPLKRDDFDTMRAETKLMFLDPKSGEQTPLTYIGRSFNTFCFRNVDGWNAFEVHDTQMNDIFASLFSLDVAKG